jgi:peptidoglycan/xylan/chitin deacetylase (PgdA/CDA1 family)
MISLLYHDVVAPGDFASSGFPGGDADIYKLEIPEFELHLQKIADATTGLPVGLVVDASEKLDPNAVLFTFDDGGASAVRIASLLEQYGWRGHFFVTTNYINKPGFLSDEHIRELHLRGHVIGSHSCSHPARMSHCTREHLESEWKESAQILSAITGEKTRTASVPGGYYSKRVAAAARAAGIEVLFNSEPTAKIGRAGGCLVLGRYSIQQGISAETAARIASGKWPPRFRQYLYWNSKNVAKRLGGDHYVTLRKFLLRKGPSTS